MNFEDTNKINALEDLQSLSESQIFDLIQATNISDIVKTRTVYGKNRLNSIIQNNPKVKEALFYIIENYKKERKNNPDKFGYMHCIEAATLVTEYWFEEADIVAAALLHDVWEDIPDGEKYLKYNYSEDIVDLVKSLTEKDKTWDTIDQEKETWEKRKLNEIKKISQFTSKLLALKLGDQISNIAETVSDLEKSPTEDRQKYWEWFNAGYDKQIWKYKTLSDTIQNRIQTCEEEWLFQDENEKNRLQSFENQFKYLVDTLDAIMRNM